MAAAVADVQSVVVGGVEPTYIAADSTDGHLIPIDGRTIIYVKNASGSSINAVLKGGTFKSHDFVDKTIAVPAGEERVILPTPNVHFDQGGANAGRAKLEFSAETSVTFAVLSV